MLGGEKFHADTASPDWGDIACQTCTYLCNSRPSYSTVLSSMEAWPRTSLARHSPLPFAPHPLNGVHTSS